MRRLAVVALVVAVVLAGCSVVVPEPPGVPPGSGGDGLGGDGQPTVAEPGAADGVLEVHFVNVGQATAVLVVGPTGETMLVDTGHFSDDGRYVLSYLRARGVDRVDHLVVSHADADHVGGNAAVIEHFETRGDGIGAIYDPGIASSTATYDEYLDAVERHGVTLYETREGDHVPFDGVGVTVMGPPDPYLADGARNENNLVLHLGFGETAFLLTGDAERRQEQYLVDRYGDGLDATVLKAGHHGSSTSSSDVLVDAVDPDVAVVSSAYDSEYGHPHEETLQGFADRNIGTYWTGTHGDVAFRSDGDRVTVLTQYDAPTDPTRLRTGSRADPSGTDPLRVRETIGGGDAVTPSEPTNDTARPSTRTATDGGTERTALEIAAINYDAPGDDRENPNEETVVFENAGTDPLDLSGWTVRDAHGNEYAFPDGTTVAAGARLTLHSGSGTDTESDLYWGVGAVWNNDGDVVVVEDATGTQVLREEYP